MLFKCVCVGGLYYDWFEVSGGDGFRVGGFGIGKLEFCGLGINDLWVRRLWVLAFMNLELVSCVFWNLENLNLGYFKFMG